MSDRGRAEDETDRRGTVFAWSRTGRWAAYAASVWAALFALRAVYWALGGSLGLGTLSSELQRQAADGETEVLTALWIVAVLLLGGAVLALALVRPWGRRLPEYLPLVGGRVIPGWMLILPAAVAGGVLLTHGLAYIALLATEGFATTEVRWYGLLWGPWFALGGGTFVLAAEGFRARAELGVAGVVVLVAGVLAGTAAAFGPRLIGWLVTLA